eukprot:6807043-Prymnesium_polylepis.1
MERSRDGSASSATNRLSVASSTCEQRGGGVNRVSGAVKRRGGVRRSEEGEKVEQHRWRWCSNAVWRTVGGRALSRDSRISVGVERDFGWSREGFRLESRGSPHMATHTLPNMGRSREGSRLAPHGARTRPHPPRRPR